MRTINKEKIIANCGHVVVLKGGQSSERQVSLISGDAVYEGLQRLGIETTVIDVGDDVISRLQKAEPGLVFNMLHGKGGEDGVIQGVLETMGLTYTGSGVLASALAMDKVRSKLIWQQMGYPTADFVCLAEDTEWDAVMAQLGVAVVKPVNGGSSLGIAIVDSAEKLEQQFNNTLKYDTEVMAERWIKGTEYSVGILQGQVLPVIQLATKRDFFNYEAKYVDEDTEIVCPADLTNAESATLNELVLNAYESLDCSGHARVDVMRGEEGVFYLLELNTIPGMTEHSFVPMAAKQAGIGFDELLLHIIDNELSHD